MMSESKGGGGRVTRAGWRSAIWVEMQVLRREKREHHICFRIRRETSDGPGGNVTESVVGSLRMYPHYRGDNGQRDGGRGRGNRKSVDRTSHSTAGWPLTAVERRVGNVLTALLAIQ